MSSSSGDPDTWDSEISSSESSELSEDDGIHPEALIGLQELDHSPASSNGTSAAPRASETEASSSHRTAFGGNTGRKEIHEEKQLQEKEPVLPSSSPSLPSLPPMPALPKNIAQLAHGNLTPSEEAELKSNSDDLEDPVLEIPNAKLFVIFKNKKHLAHSGPLRIFMTHLSPDPPKPSPEASDALSYVLEVSGWRYRLRRHATACMAMSDRHYVLDSGRSPGKTEVYFGLVLTPQADGRDDWKEDRLALEDILTDNTTFTVSHSPALLSLCANGFFFFLSFYLFTR